jgi:hypothetical protein
MELGPKSNFSLILAADRVELSQAGAFFFLHAVSKLLWSADLTTYTNNLLALLFIYDIIIPLYNSIECSDAQ